MHASPAASAQTSSRGPALSRLGLAALLIGIGAVVVAYASAFAPKPWSERGVMLMALAQPLVLVGAMALATGARLASDWRWRWTLLLTWMMATAGLVGALLLPAEVVAEALWFGVPRRTALLFGLVGVAPMIVLPLMYAITFEPPPVLDADPSETDELRTVS
ncbi:MAG: hypothetical protein IBJ03_18930 [Gemmatimonadaceae bacterium]|nr:hypothetical protein [Gemmatimonadaceae bacterium]